MKYFLIGFAIWFMVAWGTQFLKAWFMEIRFNREKKRAKGSDRWVYEI
jgi:hypothetical protein